MTAPQLRCDTCGTAWPDSAGVVRCTGCRGLLLLHHADPTERGDALRARFAHPRVALPARAASGVWRFADIVHPSAVADAVSHPEGNTPLLARDALTRFTGIEELLIKHEGHNPTGSFKDRGMTVAITQARRLGARAVVCASTGNTAASLAAYASHAGLAALVLVPDGQVASSKLAQATAYGARVLLVGGDFDACLRLVQHAAKEHAAYLVNSINPFRVEGQKTIVFELMQQLDWQPPDWIVLPAGNLGNTAAFGKALEEAMRWGLIDRVPRLVAVQAKGAAPFAAAFDRDFDRLEPVTARTVASAIRIGDPASYQRAVRAIQFTDGVVVACTDDEIIAAKRAIDMAGVGCEPASAAAVAGARALRRRGMIGDGQRVVAVLTGHLLKDTGILESMHGPGTPNHPVRIEATEQALDKALSSIAPTNN